MKCRILFSFWCWETSRSVAVIGVMSWYANAYLLFGFWWWETRGFACSWCDMYTCKWRSFVWDLVFRPSILRDNLICKCRPFIWHLVWRDPLAWILRDLGVVSSYANAYLCLAFGVERPRILPVLGVFLFLTHTVCMPMKKKTFTFLILPVPLPHPHGMHANEKEDILHFLFFLYIVFRNRRTSHLKTSWS